ncbi:NifU family protein [Mycobacterium avium]|uniref:Rieske domain-containing protein n=2 Tax=Mycobacteriaceae TaxID=1762 RepID=A0A2A7MQU6_MYCAG|nr:MULTISPECIES: NifU family protein [Mycobacteriaceae]MBN3459526.1 NifU family protein [Mycobacterium sp. DSM 3803]MCA2239286.1 NifU family protein [Mycobacterium avium]MCA2259722.1 NifU family protein [Mycobacterium avium]MCA2281016.1 NifU family protein [Mycobacterium avium]MCA2290567.1 NifU family protein [Mycobacterium avium]
MSTTVSDATPAPASVSQDEPAFEDLAKRVDDAVTALDGLDAPSRAVAEELKNAIEAIHRAGLVTMVRGLRADEAARAVLFDLVDDPVVHLLLSLHGIVRPDPMTEANTVLRSVRPQLQGHGGDVSLVRIDDGTAYVRLQGACNGCSMSSVTLRNLVEKALVEGVASVTGVEVLPNEPTATLIPTESLFDQQRLTREEGWTEAAAVEQLGDNDITALSLTGADTGESTNVIVVKIGGEFSAYVNECAHEALPLDNAVLDVANGTLTCPWHGFCYDAASGECLSAPAAQLEQLPLRVDNGKVWIRVGT